MKSYDFSVKVMFIFVTFFVFGLVFKNKIKSDFRTKSSVVQNADNANDWINRNPVEKRRQKKLPIHY